MDSDTFQLVTAIETIDLELFYSLTEGMESYPLPRVRFLARSLRGAMGITRVDQWTYATKHGLTYSPLVTDTTSSRLAWLTLLSCHEQSLEIRVKRRMERLLIDHFFSGRNLFRSGPDFYNAWTYEGHANRVLNRALTRSILFKYRFHQYLHRFYQVSMPVLTTREQDIQEGYDLLTGDIFSHHVSKYLSLAELLELGMEPGFRIQLPSRLNEALNDLTIHPDLIPKLYRMGILNHWDLTALLCESLKSINIPVFIRLLSLLGVDTINRVVNNYIKRDYTIISQTDLACYDPYWQRWAPRLLLPKANAYQKFEQVDSYRIDDCPTPEGVFILTRRLEESLEALNIEGDIIGPLLYHQPIPVPLSKLLNHGLIGERFCWLKDVIARASEQWRYRLRQVCQAYPDIPQSPISVGLRCWEAL